jgi:hypothetical protein
MTRTIALKKAQKKYYNKIKEEKGEVYQKMKQNQLQYQKTYNQKQREDPDKLIELRLKNKTISKNYYYKHRDKILEQRLILRNEKKDKEIENLLTKQLLEISFDS